MIAALALAFAGLQGDVLELELKRFKEEPLPHQSSIAYARPWGLGDLTVDQRGGALVRDESKTIVGRFEFGSALRDLEIRGDAALALTEDHRLIECRLPSGEVLGESDCDAHRLVAGAPGSAIALAGGRGQTVRWRAQVAEEPSPQISIPGLTCVDLTLDPESGSVLGLFIDREKAQQRPGALERPLSHLLEFAPDRPDSFTVLASSTDETWSAGPLLQDMSIWFGTDRGRLLAVPRSGLAGSTDASPAATPKVLAEWDAPVHLLGPHPTDSDGACLALERKLVLWSGGKSNRILLGPLEIVHAFRATSRPAPLNELALVTRGRLASWSGLSLLGQSFTGHSAPISALAEREGSLLSASLDGWVTQWSRGDSSTWPLNTASHARHEGWVNGVVWLGRGTSWVSAGRDGRLVDDRGTQGGFRSPITGLSPAAGGCALVTSEGELVVYNEQLEKLWRADAGPGVLYHTAFLEAPMPAVAAGSSELHLFDARDGKPLSVTTDFGAPITALAAGGDVLAVGLASRWLHLFGPGAEATIGESLKVGPARGRVVALAVSPKGSQVAYGDGQIVRVIDASDGTELAVARLANTITPVSAVAFSSDGATLYAGFQDGDLARCSLR